MGEPNAGRQESLRSNEIAELRHRDASRREGRPIDRVNAAIHGLGTGSIKRFWKD